MHTISGLRGPVRFCVLFLVWLAWIPGSARAQELDRPLRVFMDCGDFHCDTDFFIQEIAWVDFVQDRQTADIHVLATRQATGAGGSLFTVELSGRDAFAGERITLRASEMPDATQSDRRQALLEVIRLGLAPFAAATPAPPQFEVVAPGPEQDDVPGPEDDPWNRWVFQVGVNGFGSGESRQRFLSTSGRVTASRVTEGWKLETAVRGSIDDNEYELSDSTTFTSRRESYAAEGMLVRSLGEHWSAGGVASWRRSTFNNYDASLVVGPAVEYNVFPYPESTRRLLTFLYVVGPRYNDYRDVTLFGESREAVLEQRLVVSYDVTQPWGSVDLSLHGEHYLTRLGDDADWPDPQYNARLFGGFNVRVFRGLSARLHGSIEAVRGQIQLPAEGLTEEEILTRQRELATDYRYYVSFGLSYRFGSIFSTVVNPRFDAL